MFKSKERVFFTAVFEQISDITSICFDDYFMISQSNTFGKDDEILATSWISEKIVLLTLVVFGAFSYDGSLFLTVKLSGKQRNFGKT